MRRRDFMKGVGALAGALTLTWGGRQVTPLEDALSDAVVQEGADRGLYSQELADEIIGISPAKSDVPLDNVEDLVAEGNLILETTELNPTPKVVDCSSNSDPVEGVLRTDWSKILDDLLDHDIEIHNTSFVCQSSDVVNRFVQPELKIKRPDEVYEQHLQDCVIERLRLDHMYVSVMISDQDACMSGKELLAYYFLPSIHAVANELNKAAKAKNNELWVAPLAVMPAATACGLKQVQCTGGRIPIRVSMQYDVSRGGTLVYFDFLAHCPSADMD